MSCYTLCVLKLKFYLLMLFFNFLCLYNNCCHLRIFFIDLLEETMMVSSDGDFLSDCGLFCTFLPSQESFLSSDLYREKVII